jgi:hypothetical protein
MNKQVKVTNPLARHKAKFKKLLGLSALCTAMFHMVGVSAEEQKPYDKLSKQLDIMNNIFASSLKSQQNPSLKSTRIESLYLAGQGVVFTINSSDSFSWSRNGFNFILPDPIAPVAPATPSSGIEREVEFEFFEHSEELIEQMESAYEQQREHSHQLRDEQRDLAYELRDLERESRDLAYQLRNVSKEEKVELAKEQKAVKAQKAELEQKRAALTLKSKEMKKQQQANESKKLAARKEHYQQLTTTLVETLCTYGNSLKALPKNENVSLVLKSAGDKVARSYQDKILILSKKNITECAIDKITAEKLLASTKSYQF